LKRALQGQSLRNGIRAQLRGQRRCPAQPVRRRSDFLDPVRTDENIERVWLCL